MSEALAASTSTSKPRSTRTQSMQKANSPVKAGSGKEEKKQKKKKALPACDACKYRRVYCEPQLPPLSCSRCIDKGIQCKTTPVVRRKPVGRTGKRIEEAKVKFGIIEGEDAHSTTTVPEAAGPTELPQLSASPPDPSGYRSQSILSSTSRRSSNSLGSLSFADQDSLISVSQLSSELAAHLIDQFKHAPDAFFPLPLLARGRLSREFDKAGRRLDALPPHIEVLAAVVIAFSAGFSSHHLLLGPGPVAPDYDILSSLPLHTQNPIRVNESFNGVSDDFMLDLRDYGRRRAAVCEHLRLWASELLIRRGSMVVCGEEQAASCHLMDIMETRLGLTSVRPYASAFVSHIRSMAEDLDESGRSKLSSTAIHWSPFIMQEAIVAQLALKTSLFTKNDQRLMCGTFPSVLDILAIPTTGVPVTDATTLFWMPIQPFVHGVADLAREASETLTGVYPRTHVLDEASLERWLSRLDELLQLLAVILSRAEDQLSATATIAYNLPPHKEEERRFVARACRYTMPLAWASLVLPVWREVQRRRIQRTAATQQSALHGAYTSASGRFTKFDMLYAGVQRRVLKAIQLVGDALQRDIPSLGYLTHLQYLNLQDWATITAELSFDVVQGFSMEDQMAYLSIFIAALKRASFSWEMYGRLVDSLEQRLVELRQERLSHGVRVTTNICSNTDAYPERVVPEPAPLHHPTPVHYATLPSALAADLAAFATNNTYESLMQNQEQIVGLDQWDSPLNQWESARGVSRNEKGNQSTLNDVYNHATPYGIPT
ncbi:hypothetical protein T439DRAFT_7979 [Meredithblackwellia eburnea MCA 4105]